jgi:hypothetical protein
MVRHETLCISLAECTQSIHTFRPNVLKTRRFGHLIISTVFSNIITLAISLLLLGALDMRMYVLHKWEEQLTRMRPGLRWC